MEAVKTVLNDPHEGSAIRNREPSEELNNDGQVRFRSSCWSQRLNKVTEKLDCKASVPDRSRENGGRMTLWLHVRLLALVAIVAGAPSLAVAADDWQAQVGEALGKTGATAAGGIYRVGLPRTDLKVTLDGVELKAGFALGSWLAFEKMGEQGMVMGDLVLTMDEVAPVMTKLAAGGIEVTALHNHLLRNQPFTMYMH